ncbi:MAG TPA: ferritin-like domain-containing protein, partial [Polyangiaceae bacterium]|nr:ferritin-like domain-containing protein [Polyangiaceae bacterium]
HLPDWFRQLAQSYGAPTTAPFDASLRAWGLMPNDDYRAALEETIERDYVPRFAEYGIDARAAFEA